MIVDINIARLRILALEEQLADAHIKIQQLTRQLAQAIAALEERLSS